MKKIQNRLRLRAYFKVLGVLLLVMVIIPATWVACVFAMVVVTISAIKFAVLKLT